MTTMYDQTWTIRGLVDVDSDIFLLPGDELRILGEGQGPYSVVVNRGNRIWEKCRDLRPQGTVEPPINIREAANSKNACDGGVYHTEVRNFINGVDTSWIRLEGTLPTVNGAGEPEIANVRIWAPKMLNQQKRILIIQAEHRDGELQQNGTGHGDHK